MLMPVEQNVLAQAPETALNDLRTSSGLEKTDDRVYFLQNGIGRCFVCQVDFTSDQIAKQHLAGKKHLKNVANGQLTVLRPGTAALHLTNQPINTEFTPPGLQSGVTGAQGNMTQPDQVSASSVLCNDTSKNLLTQSPVPRRGPNGEEYQMNGSRGFCYVCNLDLTSVEHKESHIKGIKHKKKCLQTCSSNEDTADQRLAAILSNTNGVLMCRLCDVPFSCLDNARQHFASNKHKKKAALKESMGTPAVEPTMRQASAANISDETSPKVPCGSESPFVPVTDLSTDEKISESSFFRPNLANTLPPSLQENIGMRLVQPLPHRAKPESQPGINTQQPGLYTWPSETTLKEVNAPIAQSGIGGNLSSNVAEIAKVKNKQLDACGPTLQSLSSEGSSVTENEKYPEVVQKSAIYPSERDSQGMQRPNGDPSEMDRHGMPPMEGHSSNTCTAQSQPPFQVQPQSPLPPYTLNKISGQGYCNVCNVDLTSRQLADQHLNGQRHQKRLALWTSTQHNQTPLNPVASSTPVMPNPYPGRSSTPGIGPSPVNAEDNTGMISPVQSQQDETCFFNLRSSRGYCVACEIEITSVQHYDQHRLGKPHSRKRQRYLLSQQGKLYPLECGVCKKTFTGQESAQQHFTSARHKSKVEIMGEGGRELEQLDGGRIILRDSQIWYICDICDCPLNTREQYEIHQASPKHMKTLESQMAKAELDKIVETEQIPQENRSGASPSTRSPMAQILSEKKEENVLESNLQHLSFKPHNATSSQLMHGENQWDFVQVPNKPAGLTNATPPSYPNYPNTVGDQRGFLPTDRYAPDMREWSETTIPKQIYQSVDSSTQQTANCNIAASGGIAYYPRSTAKERTHSEYQDENTGSIGRDNSNIQPDVPYSSISFARDKTHVAGHTERAGDNSNVERNVNSEKNKESHSPSSLSSPCFDGSGDSGLPGIARRPVVKRGNSNRSQGPPLRDITTMEQRLSDDEPWEDSVEEADREVERANYNISESEEVAGLQSNFQKLHISDPPQTDAVIERSTKTGFKYFCTVCNKHMNTKKSLLDHEAGNLHKFNVSTIQAPRRVLPPVRNNITENIIHRAATELTRDTPRPYQLELLEQAMVRDTVIYLPTGTGKTLVAVLAIGLMLQENKTRPILFLVDKVLLVLQQEKYIREQFEGKKFKRPDVSKDGNLIDRELLVMAICGGLFSNRGVPIWKHDIIVTTADFCMNMLERGWIRWDDFSLVVLDEVHHCLKNHPYLRLFAKYHHQSQQQRQHPITAASDNQPREHLKVLGLSASPASKVTVSQTHVMLRNLLANLGGAHMAMVEKEVDDLDAYQSNAKVIPVCVPMSDNEREFTLHLLQYALRCYRQLAHLCPALRDFIATPYSYFESAVKGNDEAITRTAESLMKDIEPLMEITPCIFSLQCSPEIQADQKRSCLFDHLRQHLQGLLLLVRDIGSNSAMVAGSLLKDLAPSERVMLFEKHSLPCSDIRQKVAHFFKYGSKDMTMYKKLIATLNDPTYVNWADGSCKALVLIQKRQEAKQHAHMLRDADFVKEHQLQVSHLVGHGKGAQEGGMDVKKQKKVLDNQDRFQLIVATSIMEEGIDFQTLQLVVCMNPPTSVRALVQIRGRARKKNSHFVILCKTEEEMQKLNTLLQQEKNMAEAVGRCIEEDRGLLPC